MKDTDLTSEHVELRAELSRLTGCAPDDVVGEKRVNAWLQEQIQDIMKLSENYPHTIRLHTWRSISTDELNCFMFAFGIEPDAVRDCCTDRIFPGTQFVRFVLEDGRLIESVMPAEEGIIVYDHDGIPKHAGKYTAGRVISKWGSGATHIWEHPLFEVPSTYGDTARFFAPLADASALYCQWAAFNGL